MSKICYPSLKDKLILVTGVTSGIGKFVTLNLLSQGASVVGIGRDITRINEIKEASTSLNFVFIQLDLTQIDKIENVLKGITDNKGKLDGLVHCAGREETIPLSVYKTDKIRSIFEINTFSGIELLRLYSKKKFSNNNSSIIFFSSVMGELGQPGKVGYCATKAAILGVVKASSLELAKRKIRVNAISPGVVITPMIKQLFDQLSDDNVKEIEEMHPLGIGQVEDVTPTVLFLLSNQSKWITGQNIKIDGGYSIQ